MMVAPKSVISGSGKETKTIVRKKPSFLRKDWHKHIKLGEKTKSKRKWRAAKGRHNKIRLSVKGHQARPKIGWSTDSRIKGFVEGVEVVRVENIKEMEAVKKGNGVIIGAVGMKKRKELIAKANEMKIKIMNKYKKVSE